MDAQELPETLMVEASGSFFEPACPCLAQRPPSLCHPGCSFKVIDLLLSSPGAVDGQETDLLLDLRSLFQRRTQAETALRLFSDLRRRLEHRHYLAFYRLRRWCERHIRVEVRFEGTHESFAAPLRLDFYCIEAVRRVSMCAALSRPETSGRPRLEFTFTD